MREDERIGDRRMMSSNNSANELHINDLPDGILVHVSTYLAKPSVALLAVALVAPSTSTYWSEDFRGTQPTGWRQPTSSSNAIVTSTSSNNNNNEWSLLDFGDIENILAAKLTDDDINAVLQCISAKSNLKILKLAGCVNITGSCLNILRSATGLEQIDLSLVGKHEVPNIEPEPLICESTIIDILDSIIIQRGSSLKHLEFPTKFRNVASPAFSGYLDRYNHYLELKRSCCSKCGRLCLETGGRECVYRDGAEGYGTQNYVCSQCIHHFCADDECGDGDEGGYSKWCSTCEKEYCLDCVSHKLCHECGESFCKKCKQTKLCEGVDCENQMGIVCENQLCDDCFEKRTCYSCTQTRCGGCVLSYICDNSDCSKAICIECVQNEDVGGGECDGCGVEFCSYDCRQLLQERRKDDGKSLCLDCSLEGTSLH